MEIINFLPDSIYSAASVTVHVCVLGKKHMINKWNNAFFYLWNYEISRDEVVEIRPPSTNHITYYNGLIITLSH